MMLMTKQAKLEPGGILQDARQVTTSLLLCVQYIHQCISLQANPQQTRLFQALTDYTMIYQYTFSPDLHPPLPDTEISTIPEGHKTNLLETSQKGIETSVSD